MKITLTAASLALTTVAFAAPDARSLYNEGVEKFAAGQFREAEGAFREAVIRDHGTLQPVALYNLGHVRFAQGKETLKGEGNRQQLLDTADAAAALAQEAVRNGNEVLAAGQLQEIIGAYMQARQTRKQLRGIRDEQARALGLLGTTLARWRRSVRDFHGAFELDAANADAKFNADVVEKHIAELLKAQEQLQQRNDAVAEQREKLKQLMKALRGKIPPEMMRESDDEEGDEDDEEPQEKGEKPEGEKKKDEPKAGQEQVQRIGGEREVSPDEARLIKEMMKQRTMSPDGNKEFRTSDEQRKPEQRKGRDW